MAGRKWVSSNLFKDSYWVIYVITYQKKHGVDIEGTEG